MNYHHWWRDSRNAAGFAAECARLALPFYDGACRAVFVRSIELAEAYEQGEKIDPEVVRKVRRDSAGYIAFVASAAASVVHYAIGRAPTGVGATAANAGIYAGEAGVDPRKILDAFVSWWARDQGIVLDDKYRDAVTALLVIGEEEQAKELMS